MTRRSTQSGDLFIDGSGQLRLVDKSVEQQALEKGKVECLGMTFDSEDARRAYFTERLREKLADPEFRKTPGFPEGHRRGHHPDVRPALVHGVPQPVPCRLRARLWQALRSEGALRARPFRGGHERRERQTRSIRRMAITRRFRTSRLSRRSSTTPSQATSCSMVSQGLA